MQSISEFTIHSFKYSSLVLCACIPKPPIFLEAIRMYPSRLSEIGSPHDSVRDASLPPGRIGSSLRLVGVRRRRLL